MELPKISVTIAVLNEEDRLKACVDSVRMQDYPQENIEIIIADGGSTDRTVKLAQDLGCKVVSNPRVTCEGGYAEAVKNASHDWILYLDADNRLVGNDWLKKSVNAMIENPDAVGAEPVYFEYLKDDPPATRYCALFGINDPLAFYLGKRDRLMATEKSWTLPGRLLKETSDYFFMAFNKDSLPTVGSIGFLVRKKTLEKINWYPYLFHMDSCLDLVTLGFNKFLMMKTAIDHRHCGDSVHFLKKLKRNAELFLEFNDRRSYKWQSKKRKIMLISLFMATGVVPFIDALKGYLNKPDPAWFLHPYYSFVVVWMYSLKVIKWTVILKLRSFLKYLDPNALRS